MKTVLIVIAAWLSLDVLFVCYMLLRGWLRERHKGPGIVIHLEDERSALR